MVLTIPTNAVVMNEQETRETSGGFIPILLALGGAVVVSYEGGYYIGKTVATIEHWFK